MIPSFGAITIIGHLTNDDSDCTSVSNRIIIIIIVIIIIIIIIMMMMIIIITGHLINDDSDCTSVSNSARSDFAFRASRNSRAMRKMRSTWINGTGNSVHIIVD